MDQFLSLTLENVAATSEHDGTSLEYHEFTSEPLTWPLKARLSLPRIVPSCSWVVPLCSWGQYILVTCCHHLSYTKSKSHLLHTLSRPLKIINWILVSWKTKTKHSLSRLSWHSEYYGKTSTYLFDKVPMHISITWEWKYSMFEV